MFSQNNIFQRIRWKKITLFFLFSIFAFGALSFPKLTGRVVDEAGILSSSTKLKLTKLIKNLEQNSTNQLVVVTLKSLQGADIAEYGYQLGRHWGIGQKKSNNGVLLIVAPNERKVRIEVGYGLEGTLSDAISSIIIQEKILPYFKKGDFDNGVINGVKAIISVIKGTFKATKHKKKKDNFAPLAFFVFIFFVMIIQSLFAKKFSKYTSKIIPSSFIGFFAYVFTTSLIAGIIIFIIAYVVFLSTKAFEGGGSDGATYINTPGGYFGDSGGFGGSFGGDFGGFSGGGGGFGGGGASGSW